MTDLVVAADGGNSKTDLVLATVDGDVLAQVHAGGTVPHIDGMTSTVEDLARMTREALYKAGLAPDTPVAAGVFYLANIDLPTEQREAVAGLRRLHIVERLRVDNDVLAVLRAGSGRQWGVAVVSGAGINAIGVHPTGKMARFLALGSTTGDWGGGYALGLAALGSAIRAGDGRGPDTLLRLSVASHFGRDDPEAVVVAMHRGDIAHAALIELAPVVFAAAATGDAVATEIVARLGDEVATMAHALLRRLHLLRSDADVVLGGGTLQAGNDLLLDRIRANLLEVAPNVTLQVLDVPPVTGAVLDALSLAGASEAAERSVRAALGG